MLIIRWSRNVFLESEGYSGWLIGFKAFVKSEHLHIRGVVVEKMEPDGNFMLNCPFYILKKDWKIYVLSGEKNPEECTAVRGIETKWTNKVIE